MTREGGVPKKVEDALWVIDNARLITTYQVELLETFIHAAKLIRYHYTTTMEGIDPDSEEGRYWRMQDLFAGTACLEYAGACLEAGVDLHDSSFFTERLIPNKRINQCK